MPTSLPRATPESQGIPSSAITAFLARAENLHSLMLLRHGRVVAEGWWYPYRPQAPHMLFSLSKSFTSSAVGLAVAEGRLNIDDPLLKFFPEQAPRKISPNLAAMQVRHLLSMSTGHDQDTTMRIMLKRDPIKAFLALPVEHAPGTYFVYNSGASFILAAIVQSLTGMTLLKYLAPRLLEPLGIQGAAWESHPNGVNFGGWGLSITTEDIARFGQLYLQKGNWQGRQHLPAEWVEQATAKQVDNGTDPHSDWAAGYAFHFWRCQPPGIYRGDGAFGQYCIVLPEQDAVLAITGGLGDMQPPLSLVWEHLLPAMHPVPLPADETALTALMQTLQNLALTPIVGAPLGAPSGAPTGAPTGDPASPLAAQLSGQTFTFPPNPETLHSFSFDFAARQLRYRLLGGGPRRGTHTLNYGHANWVEGLSPLAAGSTMDPRFPHKVAASGVWTSADTFCLTLCQYETPFIVTLDFAFAGDQVTLVPRFNVSFGPTELPPLVGIRNSSSPTPPAAPAAHSRPISSAPAPR
jgi:CubicO group peptidase (beta-lactamase class C family)